MKQSTFHGNSAQSRANSPCFDFVLLVGQQLEFDVGICRSRCLGFSVRLQLTDVVGISRREKTAVHVARGKAAASNDGNDQSVPVEEIAELEDKRAELSVLAVVDLILVGRLQLADDALRDLIFGRVFCGRGLGRQRVRSRRLHARQRLDRCGRRRFLQIVCRCAARRANCTCRARRRLERERGFGSRLFVLSTHSTRTKARGNREYGGESQSKNSGNDCNVR